MRILIDWLCAYSVIVYLVWQTVECVSAAVSHLSQLTLSTDSDQVKETINQLCGLLTPAATGVWFYLYIELLYW